MVGYVYFIQVGKNGPIKIGWTERDAVARLREWYCQIPWANLRFLGKLSGRRSREKRIHNLFRKDMIIPKVPVGVRSVEKTEWFRPSKSLLQYIHGLKDKTL